MRRKAWLLLVPLLAASLACGSVVDGVISALDDDEVVLEEPVLVEPAEEQSAQPVEEQPQEPVEQADTGTAQKLAPEVLTRALSGANLSEFESYVINMIVQMNGTRTSDGSPVALDLVVDVQDQIDPDLMQLDMNISAEGIEGAGQLPGGAGAVNMIITPEQTYMQAYQAEQNICLTVPTDPQSMGFDPEDMLFGSHELFGDEDMPELLLVNPSEQINNFNTAHYRAENVQNDEFDELDIDVWVEAESDLVVKFIAHGDGVFDLEDGVDVDGSLYIEYNLISVNQGINVLIPEDCQDFSFDTQ